MTHLLRAFGLFPLLLPTYLLRFSIGPFPTTVLEMSFWIFAAVFSIHSRAVWRSGWQKLRPFHWPLFALLAASGISLFVAPNTWTALGLWRAYFLEPILFAILLSGAITLDPKLKSRILQSSTILVCAIFLWAVIGFALNLGIPKPWNTATWITRRATGPFPFPNALALLGAPFAAWFGAELFRQKKIKPLVLLGALSGLGCALLAKSVGGTLAILGSWSLLAWQLPRIRKPTIALGAIVLTIILAVPQLRMPAIQTLTFQGWSGRVRVWMWTDTVRMLQDHPILGAGLGGYPTIFRPYQSKSFIEIFQYPHQLILNFWSELGLPGLFAFAWLCITWIRVAWKQDNTKPLAFALFAILLHGLVDVPYFKNDLAMQFWMLLALIPANHTDTK